VVSLGGADESLIMAGLDIVLNILDNYPSRSPTVYFNPGNSNTNMTTDMANSLNNSMLLGQITTPQMNRVNVPGDVSQQVASILIANKDNQRTPRDPTSDFGMVETVTTLTVPNDMCGAIIGKGGNNIRQVRMSSGAKIDFTKNEPGSKEDRVITLSGTQDQIQIAEQLMSQFVKSSNNLNRGGANQQQQYEV